MNCCKMYFHISKEIIYKYNAYILYGEAYTDHRINKIKQRELNKMTKQNNRTEKT